jgi:hypothetical protein
MSCLIVSIIGLLDDFGLVLASLSRKYPVLIPTAMMGPIFAALVLRALVTGWDDTCAKVAAWLEHLGDRKDSIAVFVAFVFTLSKTQLWMPVKDYFALPANIIACMGIQMDASKDNDWQDGDEVAFLLLMCGGGICELWDVCQLAFPLHQAPSTSKSD